MRNHALFAAAALLAGGRLASTLRPVAEIPAIFETENPRDVSWADPAKNPHFATPAMRQYARFKQAHPDCILFFRLGDFYEMFGRDAVLVHRLLSITLTERTKGLPMAGVPFHSAEGYIRRLVAMGHRVAVCEQMQDPKDAKGVIERAVTRVLTPGTLVDETLLEAGSANRVAAIAIDGAEAHLAAIEVSTGAFTVHACPVALLGDEIARLSPSEIVHAEERDGSIHPEFARLAARGLALTARQGWYFRDEDAHAALIAQFGVRSLEGFGFVKDDPAIPAAGAILRYALETQATDQTTGRIPHLLPPRRVSRGQHLAVDATTLRALEIERTLRTGATEGSLLSIFDGAATPMGRRLVRDWLCYPLAAKPAIDARLDRVAALSADERFADAVLAQLGELQDVARIAGRAALGRATPRDFLALARSLAAIRPLADTLAPSAAFAADCAELARVAPVLAPLAELLARAIKRDAPAHLREGGVFADGHDLELDETRLLQRDSSAWLAKYQEDLVASTGVASLKVGYNSVFGYYIELSAANSAKAPASFTRKQTLRNAERYITPELKEFEEKVLRADARAIEREKELWTRLLAEVAGHLPQIVAFGERAGELDALSCLASVARRQRWTRPTMGDAPGIAIEGGRHPVLDRTLASSFVPNDTALGRTGTGGTAVDGAGESSPTLALITGPNMAGKSTYIRQVALIALLAHVGSFVPAAKAEIGVLDAILTRIGSADEIHSGQSTFMVEMTETANILHHATAKSLVVLDEIGRGTSTLDGLSLAWAITETLAARGACTLFATHYHELTQLADTLPRVTNLHVSVREWNDEVVFLHKIVPGRTDRSYGIHVARLAGLPRETVARAKEVLELLGTVEVADALSGRVQQVTAAAPAAAVARKPAPTPQLSLFTEYVEHPAVEELRRVDLNALTPLAAFDLLRRLVDAARG
jgi:DNA mismatch repair protein MutS